MIRKAERNDSKVLAELACCLWPENTVEEMCAALAETIDKPDAVFFLAFCEDTAVGFAQCQLWDNYMALE